MRYILLPGLLVITLNAFTQDCSTESLLKKPGTWKESSGVMQGVAAADLAKEKKTVATINSMIKSKYSPTGVFAEVNGGYSQPQSNIAVNEYIYSIIPLEYYCDGNIIKT